jgi:hypothetical protein
MHVQPLDVRLAALLTALAVEVGVKGTAPKFHLLVDERGRARRAAAKTRIRALKGSGHLGLAVVHSARL